MFDRIINVILNSMPVLLTVIVVVGAVCIAYEIVWRLNKRNEN